MEELTHTPKTLRDLETEFLEDLHQSFGERAHTFTEGLRETLFELWCRARKRPPAPDLYARHEQGHFDLTQAIAGILCSNSLSIEWDGGGGIGLEHLKPDFGTWSPLYLNTQTGEVLARGTKDEVARARSVEQELWSNDGLRWKFSDPKPVLSSGLSCPRNLVLLVDDVLVDLQNCSWDFTFDLNYNKVVEAVEIPGCSSHDKVVARYSVAEEFALT